MNFIIITSINFPTEAIKRFAELPGYKTIVIGDSKTPTDWNYNNVEYISVGDQKNLSYKIMKHLPYNHYSRKMVGYLLAIEMGADVIIDTDDDNIPKAEWGFPNFQGEYHITKENLGFVNIYKAFTDEFIWPRGLPLDKIRHSPLLRIDEKVSHFNVGIWQGLADEDPDVDAIYRLVFDRPCRFKVRPPVVLNVGTISPFNTQNTAVRKELFPLLYLPTYVTFRFTDILRGLIAQPIMWLYGYYLGFIHATVDQLRNPHNYFKDFVSEIPMYENSEKVFNIVKQSISINHSVEDNLFSAYEALEVSNIVKMKELKMLETWLTDCINFY